MVLSVGGGGEDRSEEGMASGREKRELRRQRRSSNGNNWREEVEERLLKEDLVPKSRRNPPLNLKRGALNFDSLYALGPQWWILSVQNSHQELLIDDLLRSFRNNFPAHPVKVYFPTVKLKKQMKNGSISVKSKPIFPRCMFLHCALNKQIHDFICNFPGVYSFLTKRIPKQRSPRPFAASEMEKVFQQAREEQEIADHEFEKNYGSKESPKDGITPDEKKNKSTRSGKNTKTTIKTLASSNSDLVEKVSDRYLVLGSNVRVLSGPFMGFTGHLKELNRETRKASVVFTLFGKERLVEVEADLLVAEEPSFTTL